MIERDWTLENELRNALTPAFRGRLVDRGIARSLIWNDGKLPPDAQRFADSLTDDLLDYAYTVMSMALRIRSEDKGSAVARRALQVAGEAIQSAVRKGDQSRRDQGFHRVNAAVAFHLAGHPAMAYSVSPSEPDEYNLSPTEKVLVFLFRRRLRAMQDTAMTWLQNDDHIDPHVAERLRSDPEFNIDDAAHTLITTSFMRGMAQFIHALNTGEREFAITSKERLQTTANVASDLNFVGHWWTNTLAWHLVDELWDFTLHETIPALPPDDDDSAIWHELRTNFIQRSISDDPPNYALWPSQVDAARRAIDVKDDLVIALPTSAGKTRIAEMCILRCLASGLRIFYVTPLRALSAQTERDLARTFAPLGFTVSSLYNAVDIDSGDGESLRQGHIVVCTPEKLNFALRNDPTLIDDVGLVVFDEGHMMGPGEREVRYEILLETLHKRQDSNARRLVILSALFPSPDEIKTFLSWVRQDEDGDAIHSSWRPTRQVFGTVQWQRFHRRGRLQLKVQQQRPYINNFVERRPPSPEYPRRKNPFPQNKNELILATAWNFIRQDQQVLIYSPRRVSVETLGNLALLCLKQKVLTPFDFPTETFRNAINSGIEWLGGDHPVVQCLRSGIVLHHGGLPIAYRTEIERLLHRGDCKLVIASPTLAQGLNLSASVLLVSSIYRMGEVIEAREFANVVGRAGRAFVDLEGLVLNVIWENNPFKLNRRNNDWNDLVAASQTVSITSGLMELVIRICDWIAGRRNIQFDGLLEYITSDVEAWSYVQDGGNAADYTEFDWEMDLVSLDTAILGLLQLDMNTVDVEANLFKALQGSLFDRVTTELGDERRDSLANVIAQRARLIWSGTNHRQREGVFASGVGYETGKFIDSNISELLSLLSDAESAINSLNEDIFTEAVSDFAERIFRVVPFSQRKPLSVKWQEALEAWLLGRTAADVMNILGEDGESTLQDAFMYRLPWAMEAVRVHAQSTGEPGADELTGIAATATGIGNANISAITLISSGFKSREGARIAVESTGGSFADREGMSQWLASAKVNTLSQDPMWPSLQTRHEWLQFLQHEKSRYSRRWVRETLVLSVSWHDSPPSTRVRVILREREHGKEVTVLTPEFRELGILCDPVGFSLNHVVSAWVGTELNTIEVGFYGPSTSS